MLQFLQGWLWLFAAVAALPVILHLLSRQRLKKIRFSSLMLLSRLEKSQMRRLRLRQLLLLLLRTLAVLALVAAFTRPLIRNREAPLLGEETAAVLILDESASMSAMGSNGRRTDRARAMARRITASLGAGDRLAAGPDTGSSLPRPFRHISAEWDRIIDSMSAGAGRGLPGGSSRKVSPWGTGVQPTPTPVSMGMMMCTGAPSLWAAAISPLKKATKVC